LSIPPTAPLPPVTLLVLAWNRWDLTRRCLETLFATELDGASVLVVDNGSSDGTVDRLREFPGVGVLALPQNVGFVRGNNAGIDAITAKDPKADVVLVNNDVEFRQKDWLARLRAAAHAAEDIGVVGCRQVFSDGRLLHAGTYILPDTVWGQQIGALERDVRQFTARRDVQGVTFALAYLTRRGLDRLRGLSTDYESYFEDTDYCLRAAEAGLRTVYAGDSEVIHDEHGSTEGAGERRRKLFEASRAVFRERWQAKLEGEYRGEVLWQSILNFPTGYARSSRAYLRELDEHHKVRSIYRYVYGKGSPFRVEEPENSGDYYLNVLAARKVPPSPAVAVVYGQGDVFHRAKGRRRVGFTMLEVDGFPKDWVEQANALDEVWVPSEFNRQAFLEQGLKVPIEKIPLGVDVDLFHPGALARKNPKGEYVFLASFEWGERKDPWLLLRAFSDTFSASEPVRLLCKIVNRDPMVRLKEEIARLRLKPDGGRISYLLNLEFPHEELPVLYRSADCFLAVSRGEGWDMPLMEAMACGLPTIATDWSSHREFVHDGIAYRLAVERLIPAVAKCPYYAGFRWAQADEEHLRHLLRHVYEHRDEASAKGVAAAREMAEKWTWRKAAEKIATRLRALDG
jgi:GT2 family glycosyltransferase